MNLATQLKVQNDTLTYSTNPAVTPAMTKKQGAEQTTGWKEKTITWNEDALTEMVRNEAYCQSVFADEKKVKKSVTDMYFFAVDFDKGETTFEKYKTEKLPSLNFTAFMHTTINHQKELLAIVDGEEVVYPPRDKFRVIIPLSRPITNSEAEFIKDSGVIQRLFSMNSEDIDMSFIDSNRYFKQNPEATVYFHKKDDRLNTDYLLENIVQEEKPKAKAVALNAPKVIPEAKLTFFTISSTTASALFNFSLPDCPPEAIALFNFINFILASF